MHPLLGWWSTIELTKNWSQEIHSAVLGITLPFPLFPCAKTKTPSLNLLRILRKVSLFMLWARRARSHASLHTLFPLTKNSVSYCPLSLTWLWLCRNSNTRFLLPVCCLSLNWTSACRISSKDKTSAYTLLTAVQVQTSICLRHCKIQKTWFWLSTTTAPHHSSMSSHHKSFDLLKLD